MKKEIIIPDGCKKIQIEIEGNCLSVYYESNMNDRVFLCSETRGQEERPGVGDFAIFWNDNCKDRAVCANMSGKKGGKYVSSDGYVYDNAIKFRNYEQYLNVRGIYGED